MRTMFLILASSLLLSAQDKNVAVKRMTPNLFTDDVAGCVKFWVERLHFEKTNEVPEPGGLAFATLRKGNFELMYNSYKSLQNESGEIPKYFQHGTGLLFLEVDDFEATLAAMQDVPKIAPVHKTFYGSTEFTVKDPAGHLVTFAHFENVPKP